MTMTRIMVCAILSVCLSATAALAQQLTFEREYPAATVAALDVMTGRGQIAITGGAQGVVTVVGTVTVRVGLTAPADALAVARRVAAAPPVEVRGSELRLRAPSDAADRRAVTVSYVVRVPAATPISAASESGAVAVSGVSGPLAIRTQSSAIDVSDVAGGADVQTGSGAVRFDHVSGAVRVTTSSSAIRGSALGGSFRARTQSGLVEASFRDEGDVDVVTGSSAVTLRRVAGGLQVSTSSGRVDVSGRPLRPWNVVSGSGGLDVALDAGSHATLDATTRSGSVEVDGATGLQSDRRRATGPIGGGGPLVRLENRSGTIHVSAPPQR